MARVSSFYEIGGRDGKPHLTTVECGYLVFNDRQHGRLVQLDTGGSQSREFPGKTSQTLQFNEVAAKDLMTILSRAFPNLRI